MTFDEWFPPDARRSERERLRGEARVYDRLGWVLMAAAIYADAEVPAEFSLARALAALLRGEADAWEES